MTRKQYIREALQCILDEQIDVTGATRRDLIAANCLATLEKKGEMKDLKILCDILGESVFKAEISSPQITVSSPEDAEIVKSFMEAE